MIRPVQLAISPHRPRQARGRFVHLDLTCSSVCPLRPDDSPIAEANKKPGTWALGSDIGVREADVKLVGFPGDR